VPQISVQYMIMIPVLILQIFLFPLAAQAIMNTYSDSRMSIELQTATGHMGSSIQQLYYTMNQLTDSPTGSVKIDLDTPAQIEGHAYTTTLHQVAYMDSSCQIMNVTLKIVGTNTQSSTLVTLGQNVDWPENLAFNSTANDLSLIATKTGNSIWISFGGTT
jgi:hypothetical protein